LNSGGRPPLIDPISGLRILHQLVHTPLKVLLLSHVEVLNIFGLHVLFQHLSVVVGDGLALCVLECILYDSTSRVVENEAHFRISYTVTQMKIFLHRRND
jgi:hypothetical protein